MVLLVGALLICPSSLSAQTHYSLSDTSYARSLLLTSDSLMILRDFEGALELANKADTIYINTTGLSHDNRIETWDLIGKIYYNAQMLSESSDAFEYCLAMHEKLYGKNDPRGKGKYNNLGYISIAFGKYEEALTYFRKALVLQRLISIDNSAEIAGCYDKIGMTFEVLGQLDSAFVNHKNAYDIKVNLDGDNIISAARSSMAIARISVSRGEFEEAIIRFTNALNVYSEFPEKYVSELIMCRRNLSEAYLATAQFDKALKLNNENIKILEIIHGRRGSELAIEYNAVGNINESQDLVDTAIFYYKKAIQTLPDDFIDHHFNAAIHGNLGVAYTNKGDYENALRHLQQALGMNINILGERHINVALLMVNIGVLYSETKEYDKSINILKKAEDLVIQNSYQNHILILTINNALGYSYYEKGEYSKAVQYYNESIVKIKGFSSDRDKHLHETLHLLGVAYFKMKDYSNAKRTLEQSLKIAGQMNDCHFICTGPRVYLALVYEKEKDYVTAEELFLETLSTFDIRKGESLDNAKIHTSFLVLLKNIIPFYRNQYVQFSSQNSLDNAIYFVKLAKSYIKILNTRIESKSRKHYLEEVKNILEQGIITNLVLYGQIDSVPYLYDALELSELSRTTLLQEAMQASNAIQASGISDNQLKKEHTLRTSITRLEKRRQEHHENGFAETDTKIISTSKELIELYSEHDQFLSRLEKENPHYFKAKYNVAQLSLASLQERTLTSNKTLLEYFVGDSSIFIFTITKDTFHVEKVVKDFPLKMWVEHMRSGIYTPFQNRYYSQDFRDSLNHLYTTSAYQLYEKLILPVKAHIPDGSELIVVPDGVLGYVPFDALLTTQVDNVENPRGYPYLLKDHQTSIAYSATLLMEMQNKKHVKAPNKTFLAMAPIFEENNADSFLLASRFIDMSDSRNRLSALSFNIPEVTNLQKLVGGDILTNADATEEAFRNAAPDYKILHLSTHGKANDKAGDYSFLAFYELKDSIENEWLYNRELYDLELNADMVVLSACETGIGELQRGEGIISLARGFSYAGAKSIITSLWSVDDAEAPVLMNSFYTYLKDGLSKDAALRQAKLDYIQTSTKPAPYYWATFIPIGDMSPIDFDQGDSISWLWWALGVGVMALLFIATKRFKL
jgi:CHAT domain-containing protein/Tfp pilus assembly protein PilF